MNYNVYNCYNYQDSVKLQNELKNYEKMLLRKKYKKNKQIKNEQKQTNKK